MTVIGRPVDPLGDLSLSQLCVVAALCLKRRDESFDAIGVSVEHLRLPTGPEWAPAALVLNAATSEVRFSLASLQHVLQQTDQGRADQGSADDSVYRPYRICEPALHDLLSKIQTAALAMQRGALRSFIERLRDAVARGVDPARRRFAPP